MKKEIKQEGVKREIKQEGVKRELVETFQSPSKYALVEDLSSPALKAPGKFDELSQALVAQGFSPPSKDLEMRSKASSYGQLGAHHGIKGAEFGVLGGRPPKRKCSEIEEDH